MNQYKKSNKFSLLFILILLLFITFCTCCYAVSDYESVSALDVQNKASDYKNSTPAGTYINENGITLCMGFVADFWRSFGYTRSSAGSAKEYADWHSLSYDPVPIGADVFFDTGIYWHIGVYIGNNQFINVANDGSLQYSDMTDSYFKLRYRGWCFHDYVSVLSGINAPTVQVSPLGTEVDISWNDVGANSYYIYVQNKDNQSIPYSNNIGKNCSIHLGLAEGNFVAHVTAVYSSDNMKTTSVEFTTKKLLASINKETTNIYDLDEPILISINTDINSIDSCVLKIYRTPTGGDTYEYWEGQLFSPQYKTSFSSEGHYSCVFIMTRNNHSIESGWVGWDVIEHSLSSTVDKGQNGNYTLNEPVLISVNADVSVYDSCHLNIYRTPTGGETYKYWEGQLFSPQYTTAFSEPGYYSCCFSFVNNNKYTESGWVGWSVLDQEPVTLTLPASLTTIEDEAFAGIKDCVVRLPDGVSYVSPSAFDSSVRLLVKAGTSAAEAVKGLGLTVIVE